MLRRLRGESRACGDAVTSGLVIVPGWRCWKTRTLLAGSVSWINPNGGDWEIGSNWSDGIVPTSFEDANITIPVSNPITLSEADQVDSLNTDDPIVLGPGSSLSIVRTAGLSASTTLQGGTIEGGTISATDGATLVSNGGTLSGVTVVNTLDITGSSTTVTGGLTLNGGTIELGSSGDEGFDLVFQVPPRAWAAPGRSSWEQTAATLTRKVPTKIGYADHRQRRDHRGIGRHHRLR